MVTNISNDFSNWKPKIIVSFKFYEIFSIFLTFFISISVLKMLCFKKLTSTWWLLLVNKNPEKIIVSVAFNRNCQTDIDNKYILKRLKNLRTHRHTGITNTHICIFKNPANICRPNINKDSLRNFSLSHFLPL